MKKSILFYVYILFLLPSVYSQKIQIIENKPVKGILTGEYQLSGISPNRKSLLLTKAHSQGLYVFELKTGRLQTITALPGSGYRPAFSKRGKFLVYRWDNYIEKTRLSSINKVKLKKNETTVVVDNERVVSVPYVLGNEMAYTLDGKLKSDEFIWWMSTDPDDYTFVISEDLQPTLWIKGYKKTLQPNGEGSYIWVSMSPDKKKILYYFVGKGAFVCDLNGKILLEAGNLLNPSWLKKDLIIGIGQRNGTAKSTSTDIVAYSVQTKKKMVVTNTANVNERNPFPFSNGKGIAYQLSDGSFHICTLKIR